MCAFILPLIVYLIFVAYGISTFDTSVNMWLNHTHYDDCYTYRSYYSDYSDYLWDSMIPTCRYSYFSTGEDYAMKMFLENEVAMAIIVLGAGIIVCAYLFFLLNFQSITITDKRVYGRIAFGKRVDLPIDSISSVAKIQGLKGITVLSSSKKRKFLLFKNIDDIYSEISKQLIDRQKQQQPIIVTNPTQNITDINSPDDLLKFKELLDKGVITQEEFEAKKKQILGL